MTSRERIALALSHKEADRVAIQDAPWSTTIERWHQEGLPEKVSPGEYFDYEVASIGADTSFQFPSETLEETDEYIITSDANGARMKNWKRRTSTPELIGFTITSRQAWEENRARREMNEARVDWVGSRQALEKARGEGKFVVYGTAFGYDKHSCIVGPESLLPAMVEDPSWPAEMFMQDAELNIVIVEEMLGRGFEFDGGFVYDDMGYRNATFFSPRAYRQVLFPAHKRICDFFHSKKMPVILHSCGRVREFVPMLIEAGFDCLQPLEVKAGMDLLELKKEFGEVLAFMGGIDVRAMANPDPEVIEKEIAEKIPFAKKGGGYIYHSDHSVPDNVSFQQYCRVIELVKRYGKY